MEETRAPAPADTATAPQETTPQETTPQEPVSRDVTEIKLPPHKEKIDQMLSEYESRQAARKEQRAREEAKPPPEPETLRKGESWDDIYARSSPEQQRALASLRASTTRKQQELARERRAQQAARDALLSPEALEGVPQTGQLPEDFDIYNPDHFGKFVEARVAQALQKVIEPARKAQEKSQARAKFEQFREDHPDLLGNEEVKAGVTKMLKEDPRIDVPTAYWAVKGKLAARDAEKREQLEAVRRSTKREAAKLVSQGRRARGSRRSTQEDMSGSAYEIYLRQKALHSPNR